MSAMKVKQKRGKASSHRDPIGNAMPRDFIAGYLGGGTIPASAQADAPKEPPSRLTVAATRNSVFYNAHSYHTKVPPEAISPFIEHFSKPGDVVLDPFCGSGMTGVAAALSGRRAILNDLSSVASHLAWNHTRPCEGAALIKTFSAIEEDLSERVDRLYSTRDANGAPAMIRWVLWSTMHRCPACSHVFSLWSTMDRATGRLGRSTRCPCCSMQADRRRFQVTGNQPAWIAYVSADGRPGERAADERDVAGAAGHAPEPGLWYPKAPLGPDREMYQRCALHLNAIGCVSDLYTPRNLTALALLWQRISSVDDERIKRALAFAFTNTAWHGTRMRRFNARGGHRPLTGTLYVPQLSSEANVLRVMAKKVRHLAKYYDAFQPEGSDLPYVMNGSATNLGKLASGSVDYVFTDPPFGSNIFYADCNLVWESWLGRVTDMSEEAVVNRSLRKRDGGKDLHDYGRLMDGAMKEMARVLKAGGWATVVFHNTDASVWKCLREAAAAAGFEFHEAASLDRAQQSHKGYRGRSGQENVAHFDVVLNLRKPVAMARRASMPSPRAEDIEEIVTRVAQQIGMGSRGVQGVHAEVLRHLMSKAGDGDLPNYKDIRTILARQKLASAC